MVIPTIWLALSCVITLRFALNHICNESILVWNHTDDFFLTFRKHTKTTYATS